MTSFHTRLQRNVYSEWASDYIDYAKLKRLVKQRATHGPQTRTPMSRLQGVRRSRSTSYLPTLEAAEAVATTPSETQRLLLRSRQPDPFDDALETEYNKVERAYKTHVAHYAAQLEVLRSQYRPNASAAALESLTLAFVELHRLLTLLSNFALLNYKGFARILSKRDSHSAAAQSTPSRYSPTRSLEGFAFADARECHGLLHTLEQTFADLFCNGRHALARATLLTKREDAVNWSHMYIGIKIGSCLILIVWVVWDSLVVPTLHASQAARVIPLVETKAYPVYRGIGCLLLLHWLVGLSLYVWRKARINYRYIFELDPRNTQQYAEVFSDATNMTIVFLVNVLLYYKVVNGYFPEAILHRGYYPLALALFALYYYVLRHWERQRGLRQTLFEIVCSPFYAVTFFHTFVGNYLSSVVKVNQDLCWSVCFFATREFLERDELPSPLSSALDVQQLSHGSASQSSSCSHNFYYVNVAVPLICALPLWWRFLQCLRRIYDMKAWWPNLPNAFKYALAQVVALFGIFHPFNTSAGSAQTSAETFQVVWVAFFTLSSMYTWVWDVTMDWGLGRPEVKLRGYRQMFSRNWIYTVAVVGDFFLCFAWTLSLIPHRSSDAFLLYLQPFTMVAELFRRTFWSFFTLENEHLRNTHGFQRADFIPLHYDSNSSSRTSGTSDEDDEYNCHEHSSSAKRQTRNDELVERLGGIALVANIALLAASVVGLSVVAIVMQE